MKLKDIRRNPAMCLSCMMREGLAYTSLDHGLICTADESGVLLRLHKTGCKRYLTDFLKSCVRHGYFDRAGRVIREYVRLKRKGFFAA